MKRRSSRTSLMTFEPWLGNSQDRCEILIMKSDFLRVVSEEKAVLWRVILYEDSVFVVNTLIR